MKNLFNLLLIATVGFVITACSSEDSEGLQNSNKVKVTFVYTLDTSNGNSMSRAVTNEDVFNEFYEKIKNGELVAQSYNFTLTEVNTGVVYTFNGQWDSNDFITLNTGVYRIVGASTADGDNIQENALLHLTNK